MFHLFLAGAAHGNDAHGLAPVCDDPCPYFAPDHADNQKARFSCAQHGHFQQVFVFPQGLGLLKVEAVLHLVDRTPGGTVFKLHAYEV